MALKKVNRKLTLKKKASELATLCDVSVCMVTFGADGKVETWPENKTHVLHLINKYKRVGVQKEKEREKAKRDLLGFLESKKENLEENLNRENNIGNMVSNWDDDKLKQFSMDELMGLHSFLDSKLKILSGRIGLLQNYEKENAVLQVCNEDIGAITNPNDVNMMMNECYQPLLPVLFDQEAWPSAVADCNVNYSGNFMWGGGSFDLGKHENFSHVGQNYSNNLEGDIDNNFSIGFGHFGFMGESECSDNLVGPSQSPPTPFHGNWSCLHGVSIAISDEHEF